MAAHCNELRGDSPVDRWFGGFRGTGIGGGLVHHLRSNANVRRPSSCRFSIVPATVRAILHACRNQVILMQDSVARGNFRIAFWRFPVGRIKSDPPACEHFDHRTLLG